MFRIKNILVTFIFVINILFQNITLYADVENYITDDISDENIILLKNKYEKELNNFKTKNIEHTLSVEQRMNLTKYIGEDITVYLYFDDDELHKYYNVFRPLYLVFDIFSKQTGLSFDLQRVDVDQNIPIEKQLKSLTEPNLCLDIIISNDLALFDLNNPDVTVTSPFLFEELYAVSNSGFFQDKSQEDIVISYDASTFSLQSNIDTESFNFVSNSPKEANIGLSNGDIDLFYSTTANLPTVTKNSENLYQYASISQTVPNLTYALYGVSAKQDYSDLIDILDSCITDAFILTITSHLDTYTDYIKNYSFYQSLTSTEQDYIKNHNSISVYYNEIKNLLYQENNEFKGLLVDIFNQISFLTGLDIEYIMPEELYINDSNIDMTESINIISLYTSLVTTEIFNSIDPTLSNSYSATPTIFNHSMEILKNGNSPDITKITELIFTNNGTTNSFLLNTEKFIENNSLNNKNLTIYDSEQDLINALISGEIDYAFVPPGTLAYYSNQTNNLLSSAYHKQSLLNIPTNEWQFLLHDETDVATLTSIISKAIVTLDYAELNNEWLPSQYEYTLYNDIKTKNNFISFIMILVLFASITIILHFYTTHKRNIKKLLYVTNYNALTGLKNLKSFEKDMPKYKTGSFAILHIKNMKQANQTYGMPKMDMLINYYAESLVNKFGQENVYRVSGSNFYIYYNPNFNSKENYEEIAIYDLIENIYSDLGNGIYINNRHYDIESIVVGVNLTTFYNIERNYPRYLEDLIEECKNNNTNFAELDEKNFNTLGEKEIIKKMLHKINNSNILPYYQPFVDTKTKKVKGCEVLARLLIDDEIIPAYKFIKIADTIGVLCDIDRMLLEKTIALRSELLSNGYITTDFYFSINFSAQFLRKLTTEYLYEITRRFNIRSLNFLQIEILEEALTQEEIEKIKRIIREFNLNTAIDDFSTGHSTISRLNNFQFDVIKMDRSLLPINLTDLDKQIYLSLLAMISNFSLDIVVEGVETEEHVQFLETTNVKTLQGFFFAKPMCKNDFINYVITKNI